MVSILKISKPRTAFGKWLDQQGIEQKEIEVGSKLSRPTVSKLANDKNFKPTTTTVGKIKMYLKKEGHDINFW